MRTLCISFLIVTVLFAGFKSSAQNDSIPGMVAYSPDFEFAEGVYIHFGQLKKNEPIAPQRFICNTKPGDYNFYENLLAESETVKYYDNLGNIVQVPEEEIWGYSDKGTIYIRYADDYYRIPVFGQISHFVATVTVEYYDPMATTYGTYASGATTTKRELRQFLFDYKSGEVYPFNHKNLQSLLSDDHELSEEYSGLRNRKKKKEKFTYIRKYNDKNPVYFPAK